MFDNFLPLLLIPLIIAFNAVALIVGRKYVTPRINIYKHPLAKFILSYRGLRSKVWRKLFNLTLASSIIILSSIATSSPYVLVPTFREARQSVEAIVDIHRKPVVMILLDVSGSMRGEKIEGAIEASTSLIEELRGKALIGLVAFAHYVVSSVPPTSRYDELITIIQGLTNRVGGGTIYSKPLNYTLNVLTPYLEFNTPTYVIFVSDGLPYDVGEYLSIVLNYVWRGIPIYTIFIDSPTLEEEERVAAKFRLNEIASLTNGKFYSVENVQELTKVFHTIARETLVTPTAYTLETKVTYIIDEKHYLINVFASVTCILLFLNYLVRFLWYRVSL